MRLFSFFRALGITALVGVVAMISFSCSSDDPLGCVSFERLLSEEMPRTFSLDTSSLRAFYQEKAGDKWKEEDMETVLGYYRQAPLSLTFYGGKLWRHYEFGGQPSNPLRFVWDAYCKIKGVNRKLCLLTPIEKDGERYVLNTNKYRPLIVTDFYKDGFEVTSVSEAGESKTGSKEIGKYRLSEGPDATNMLFFDSERELATEVISMIRNDLGNEFVVIGYFGSRYVNTVVNLDETEQEMLDYLDRYGL